jgi:hypothetical protein
MRGVYLPAGTHTVEFTYHVSTRPLAVSVAAIVIGFALLGWVMADGSRRVGLAQPTPPVGT